MRWSVGARASEWQECTHTMTALLIAALSSSAVTATEIGHSSYVKAQEIGAAIADGINLHGNEFDGASDLAFDENDVLWILTEATGKRAQPAFLKCQGHAGNGNQSTADHKSVNLQWPAIFNLACKVQAIEIKSNGTSTPQPESLGLAGERIFVGTETAGEAMLPERWSNRVFELTPSGKIKSSVQIDWAPFVSALRVDDMSIKGNMGIEGLCVSKNVLWAFNEHWIKQSKIRYAPLVATGLSSHKVLARYLVKLPDYGEPIDDAQAVSALACDNDGSLWALYRSEHNRNLLHIRATLLSLGGSAEPVVIEPTACHTSELRDYLSDKVTNWEGLAISNDGLRLFAISDNNRSKKAKGSGSSAREKDKILDSRVTRMLALDKQCLSPAQARE